MAQFFEPDLGSDPNNPFARDADGKLVRRSYWLDMPNQSVMLALTAGVGIALSNEQKRAHLSDIGREHLVDEICLVEILPPED